MNPKNANHLHYGKLIALAQLKSNSNKGSAEMLHINGCPQCEDIYKYLVSYSKSALNPSNGKSIEPFIINNCPASDMDYIDLLLTILNDGLADEYAAKIFKHMNNCYACFEKFSIDWTAYVSVKMN